MSTEGRKGVQTDVTQQFLFLSVCETEEDWYSDERQQGGLSMSCLRPQGDQIYIKLSDHGDINQWAALTVTQQQCWLYDCTEKLLFFYLVFSSQLILELPLRCATEMDLTTTRCCEKLFEVLSTNYAEGFVVIMVNLTCWFTAPYFSSHTQLQ